MSSPSPNTVATYEAKSHFSELLERVEAGEQVTITRDGTPVAHLVPVRPMPTAKERRVAIQAIRKLASRNRLRGVKVKNLIAEGRR